MNDYGYACNTCDGSGYLRRCRRCHVNDAPISRRTEDEQRRVGGICWECEIAQVQARVFDDRPVIHLANGMSFNAVDDDGER